MNAPCKNDTDNSKSQSVFLSIILAASFTHFFNDIMQSVLPSVYPLLRDNYQLNFLQIGIITAIYQMTGFILQPLIGFYTDKHPLPYLLPFSSVFTCIGIFILALASHYYFLLCGAALIGLGSSIFHPEASRIARVASNGKHGFAQSFFQVGGNTGSAIGPVIAALIISYQERILWLTPLSIFSIFFLLHMAKWYYKHLKENFKKTDVQIHHDLSKNKIIATLALLIALMFAKYIYLAVMQNYYIFFIMDKFHLPLHQAQFMLFLYLAGIALGTVLGGPISDKIGARIVIWISILGVLPFTLMLPFANLYFSAILSMLIGIILASAFPAIVVFAQKLVPGKPGTIAGFLFGLAFGIGSLSTSLLGYIGDNIGLEKLFIFCAFSPILGIIAIWLPKFELTYKANKD